MGCSHDSTDRTLYSHLHLHGWDDRHHLEHGHVNHPLLDSTIIIYLASLHSIPRNHLYNHHVSFHRCANLKGSGYKIVNLVSRTYMFILARDSFHPPGGAGGSFFILNTNCENHHHIANIITWIITVLFWPFSSKFTSLNPSSVTFKIWYLSDQKLHHILTKSKIGKAV